MCAGGSLTESEQGNRGGTPESPKLKCAIPRSRQFCGLMFTWILPSIPLPCLPTKR